MVANIACTQKNEPRLIIMKRLGKTPFMATCATCHTKFFTPLDLVNSPRKAELHLLDEFASHKCKAHFADAA